MLAQLKKHYGRFRAAEPIYNGRNGLRFVPGVKENLIFTAGRLWDEAKNIAILGPIAANLSWPVYAAGELSGPGGVRAELQNLRVLGRLDGATLACWLGRAAIFVLPARYEPFGLSVLEAALAGCALVLGDTPSLREIWHDAALFAAPDSRQEIAAALAALIADPPLRWRLARQARSRALAFTPQRMGGAYAALYSAMLTTAKVKACDRRGAHSETRLRP
jgi:glycosyltransferase involved in cell wall biosynthesis